MESVEKTPKPLPKPNPRTQAEHRRQMIRQVSWPLIIGILAILAVVVTMIINNIGSVELWSQIAMIFVVIPTLLLGLFLLVLLIGVSIGIGQLLHFLPPYARLTQDAIDKVGQQVRSGAEVSMKPVKQIQRFIAMIEKFFTRK